MKIDLIKKRSNRIYFHSLHFLITHFIIQATSKSSMMAAKTLQNHTKATMASNIASRTMASRPAQSSRPTNLKPQQNSRSTDSFLIYETVDKPAEVGLLNFI